MKAYTKKQIKAMHSAITGAWLAVRPSPRPWASRQVPASVFSRVLSEKRREVVLEGIRERVRWHEEHAAQSRGSAAHFAAHPAVYGTSTPEAIARLAASAKKYDKDAAWFRALEQKILSDGLPPEVESFDPTASPSCSVSSE